MHATGTGIDALILQFSNSPILQLSNYPIIQLEKNYIYIYVYICMATHNSTLPTSRLTLFELSILDGGMHSTGFSLVTFVLLMSVQQMHSQVLWKLLTLVCNLHYICFYLMSYISPMLAASSACYHAWADSKLVTKAIASVTTNSCMAVAIG